MAYQGNGYDRPRQGEDIPMSHYNPGYNDDSLPYESRQVVVDMNQRRGSDASSDTYPAIIQHGSSRRQWAAVESPRDTAELINALPSRQLEQLASDVANKDSIRRRKSSKKSFHGTMRAVRGKDLEELEKTFSKNEDYMDELDGEARTTETLKNMPLSMQDKKKLKRSTSMRRRELTLKRGATVKSPGWFKRAKYNLGITWMHFKQRMAEFAYSLELWRSHLKKIEGHFGTGVTSYFLFLKWIFLLNIPVFVLTFGFVVIPQIVYRYEIKDPPGYATAGNGSESFTGKELLTGAGWFTNTELYYGFYEQSNISLSKDINYNMKYAYLFTCGGYYIMCLIILALSISRSYKTNYIEGSGTHTFYNVSRVFCGWDYNITDQAAAKLKHKSFFNEMKEFLSGSKNKKKDDEKKLEEKCKWFFIRLLTNILILGMIGGLAFLVYQILHENYFVNGITILKDMALSLCVSAIILVFPPIFSLIARLENYEQPKNELIINMIRTMLLKTSILAMLVFDWFRHAGERKCWETLVGQEIYRLVLVDFIFILGATFCLEFLRRIFGTYCCKISRPEFDIGRNTLDLIYSQGLCWLGTFYSPLLSGIMIVKLFLIFYVKMISVLQNCQPSLRPWRASRTHTIFLGFLFFFFILATVAVAVGIITVHPSTTCGPYKTEEKAYGVVTDLVNSWRGDLDFLRQIIKVVSSPGFVASVLVALCVGTYYMRIIMIGHKEMVKLLRQQLAMEGRDKAYLLNMLQDVSRKKKNKLNPSNVNRLLSPATGSTLDNYRSPGGKQFARTVADSVAASGHINTESPRNRRRWESNGGVGAAPH